MITIMNNFGKKTDVTVIVKRIPSYVTEFSLKPKLSSQKTQIGNGLTLQAVDKNFTSINSSINPSITGIINTLYDTANKTWTITKRVPSTTSGCTANINVEIGP